MANLTKTLKVQNINAFGPSPSTKWNSTFKWTTTASTLGNGCWGVKSAGSQASVPILKNVFKRWTKTNVATVSGFTNLQRGFNKVWGGSITPAYANSNKTVTDGRGDYYLFPDRTTNAEIRFSPTYASHVASVTNYTSGTVVTTIWS